VVNKTRFPYTALRCYVIASLSPPIRPRNPYDTEDRTSISPVGSIAGDEVLGEGEGTVESRG
jgi:hypothetical protein